MEINLEEAELIWHICRFKRGMTYSEMCSFFISKGYVSNEIEFEQLMQRLEELEMP